MRHGDEGPLHGDKGKRRGDQPAPIERRSLVNNDSIKPEEELRVKRNQLGRMMREATRFLETSREAYRTCEQHHEDVIQRNNTFYQTMMELREVNRHLGQRASILAENVREVATLMLDHQRAQGEYLLTVRQNHESSVQEHMDAMIGRQVRIELYALLYEKRLEGTLSQRDVQRATHLLQQERQAWDNLPTTSGEQISLKARETLQDAMTSLQNVMTEIVPGSVPERLYRQMVGDREKRPTGEQTSLTQQAAYAEGLHVQSLLPPGWEHMQLYASPSATIEDATVYMDLVQKSNNFIKRLYDLNQYHHAHHHNSENFPFYLAQVQHRDHASHTENRFQSRLKFVEEYREQVEAMKKRGKDIGRFEWPGREEDLLSPPYE